MKSYVLPEDVTPLLPIPPTGAEIDKVSAFIKLASGVLDGHFASLRSRWEQEEESSQIKQLVKSMLTMAVLKMMTNPHGFSGETMGSFAYSRFGSSDWMRNLFDKDALDRLRLALEGSYHSAPMSISARPTFRGGSHTTTSGFPVRRNIYRR